MNKVGALLLAVLCVLATVSSASAAWKTGSFVDRMTDKKFSYAELPAKDGNATLYVGCMNGNIMPDIRFPARIGYGQLGVTYRFDEGPVVPRIVQLPSDGKSLWLWISGDAEVLATIKKSKRLRVQTKEMFLDFDLTGSSPAISPIRCK
jgi:hypothetical protein